jgi:hypothetical protein
VAIFCLFIFCSRNIWILFKVVSPSFTWSFSCHCRFHCWLWLCSVAATATELVWHTPDAVCIVLDSVMKVTNKMQLCRLIYYP